MSPEVEYPKWFTGQCPGLGTTVCSIRWNKTIAGELVITGRNKRTWSSLPGQKALVSAQQTGFLQHIYRHNQNKKFLFKTYPIPFKSLGSVRFFNIFEKMYLKAFIGSKIQYKRKNCEILLTWFKISVFYFSNFLDAIYSNDGKAEFSAAIAPVFSVTCSFRNNLIWCSRNIFYYYY